MYPFVWFTGTVNQLQSVLVIVPPANATQLVRCVQSDESGQYSTNPVTSGCAFRTIIRTHRSMQQLYAKHLARNAFTRTLVTAGIWLRAALLITTVWVRRHPLRLRRP